MKSENALNMALRLIGKEQIKDGYVRLVIKAG
jgi:hypothetical protein